MTKRAILFFALILSLPLGTMSFVAWRFWPISPPVTTDPRVKVLGDYGQGKIQWIVLLIPQNFSQEELITLAREVRTNRRVSHFEIYDSDAQIEDYLAWARNNDARPFPEEFVRRHRRAAIRPILYEGSLRWCLFRPSADPASLRYSHMTLDAPAENVIVSLE